tara:strand:- start:325 stop:507 length:183 start_codon:yes stop_codon:yes gene_type:complete
LNFSPDPFSPYVTPHSPYISAGILYSGTGEYDEAMSAFMDTLVAGKIKVTSITRLQNISM